MATFYLLPPRAVMGRAVQSFLGAMFPGLAWPAKALPDLVESLSETARAHADVFVVHQEDLPEDADPATALVRDFGAQCGDEVVEVRPRADGVWREAARWRLPVAA